MTILKTVHGVGIGDNGRFYVGDNSYDTLAKAAEAIDRKAKAEAANKRAKLSLAVVSAHGVIGHITGIHATQGVLLMTKGMKSGYHSDTVYPDTPEVRSLVAKQMELDDLSRRCSRALNELEIDYRPGVEQIANLKADYASKLGKTKFLDVEKVLATPVPKPRW